MRSWHRFSLAVLVVSVGLAGGLLQASSQEMMRGGGEMDRGRMMDGVGIGLAVGNIIGNAVRRDKAVAEEDAAQPRRAPPKKKAARKPPPKEPALVRKKPAPDKAGPKLADRPEDQPVRIPALPALETCEDCTELFTRIIRLGRQMREDQAILDSLEETVAQNEIVRQKAQSNIRKVSDDRFRKLYEREAANAEKSIDEFRRRVADVKDTLAKELALLTSEIERYHACVDRYCPKTVDVPPPPQAPPVDPPVTRVDGPPPVTPVTPPPDEIVASCGPDITPRVFDILRKIRQDFKASPATQADACRSLFDPRTAPFAWDISGLGPGSAPLKGMQYDAKEDAWVIKGYAGAILRKQRPWLTDVDNRCARPAPKCAATVEFLGTCQHPQVVNYLQWGLMLKLCGAGYEAVGDIPHAIWNKMVYGDTAPTCVQLAMGRTASDYVTELDDNEKRPFPEPTPRLDDVRDRFAARMKSCGPSIDCPLLCPKTEQNAANVRRLIDGNYVWTGLEGGTQRARVTPGNVDTEARKVGGPAARDKIEATVEDANQQVRDKISR